MKSAPARVLVVDDDQDIRSNISDILNDLGYQVSTAADAEAALEIAADETFDIALLDFRMPGMDGAKLYRRLKELQPAMVAIMVTAWASGEGVKDALDAGTWDVLRKPVEISELLEKISDAASAKRVLVVDDDHDFCNSLWQILNERRFRVAIAHSEADGIRQVKETRCEIAIVDLMLGNGDGRRVIESINKVIPNAMTIVVSGEVDETELGRARQGEWVSMTCRKPIDLDQLFAALN